MSKLISEAEFAANLNSVFRINADLPEPFELKLVEVNHKNVDPTEEAGMERFSIILVGPNDRFIDQQMYPLKHDVLGEVDLFLVPIGRETDGFRYEAVFNYYKSTAAE
jgi:hypothetical protein